MARESEREDAFITLARDRFTLAEEAEHKQRERERDDLAFIAGDMWSKADLDAREAQPATGTLPPVGGRPAIVINKLQEPLRQVTNQERSAEMGIELAPADDFGGLVGPQDESEIELREGLIRRIQRESNAADARTWAFDRAVKAGRGYYGVMTRYVDGKSFDKEIFIRRFYNQASVLLDPSHEQPDGSDAQWGFVGVDLTHDEYTHQYGENDPIARADDDTFRAWGDEAKGWFRQEGKTRIYRVTEYWWTKFTTRTLALLPDGTAEWLEALPKNTPTIDTREVTTRTIMFSKINGWHRLEKDTEWEGQHIPIIKVLGNEVQPYDAERRAEGMVRQSRGSNQGYNAMVSKLVETIGNAPIPPFQATIDQVQGFEAWYQMANTRALPFLPYNLISDGGKPLPPPTRTPVDTPIQSIVAAIAMFDQGIKSTTGLPDASLGNVDPSVRSGKAIRFLQEQAIHGTSNFLDNLKRSMRFEGMLENELLYPVYGKRGRIARIINKLGEGQMAAINMNGQAPQPQSGQTPAKAYALTETMNCNVIVKIQRAHESRREEQAAVLTDLISAQPQFVSAFGDLYFESLDVPGHQQLAERAKLMLAPPIQQALQAQKQGPMAPEQLQGQMMQMQQRLQEAEQVMHAQQQELSTRQADAKIKLQIAELGADKDIKLQTMRDASALAVAKINALVKGVISDNEAQLEAVALAAEQDRTAAQFAHETHTQVRDHVHEHVQSQLDRQHQAQTQAMTQAHQSASADIQRGADAVEADANRAHEVEMQPEEESETEPV